MKFGSAMFFTEYSIERAGAGGRAGGKGFRQRMGAPEKHSHISALRAKHRGSRAAASCLSNMPTRWTRLWYSPPPGAATKTIRSSAPASCLCSSETPFRPQKLVASYRPSEQGRRFLFGIGGGWNQDEMENHGTVYATRFKRMRESIEAMKEIWTKPKAEYHGEFVNFDPMMAWPKPVQKPYPPIHVGGAFPHGAKRAIRYGDGWIPTARGDLTVEIVEFQKMARDAGRDPASIEITSFGLAEDLDRLKRLMDLGVARVVPMFPPERSDKVLPVIDRWAKLMQQVNG